ncbi:hypothetical protein [Salmonella enterica]|uniref:hypothetical protein n=1 Tax=Salmonella enterica TaxID=28901 RepID=UPI002237A69D|nr:hypothetical protein [Salmonella enterica]MCW6831724.1 hypothetical protein [Salmonella enterica]
MYSSIEHQKQLETLFNKNQLIPRMRKEFEDSEEIQFTKYFEHIGIDPKLGIDAMVQIALHKRADIPTMVGSLMSHSQDAQYIADTLLKMAEHDCFDFDPSIDKFIVIYEISDDVQLELEAFQYPLPIVSAPKPVKCNRDTGYYESRGSIILKKNHHEMDVCLDHINRMNNQRLCINWDVANYVKDSRPNMDKPKEGETRQDYEKRVKAFEKYSRTAKEVMELVTKEGNNFSLAHRYDKRGRTYCSGYHINYAGTSWNKAVVEFAQKELVED